MLKFLFKRLILDTLALIIMGLLIYFMLVAVRGNPFNPLLFKSAPDYYVALVHAGIAKWINPANHKQGIVLLSISSRFFAYINGIFHGSFGIVFQPGQMQGYKTAPPVFLKPLKYTAMVTVPAWLFSSLLGIGFGVLSGYKRGTWVDSVITFFIILFFGIPTFIIAPLFILIGPSLGIPVTFIDALRDPVFPIWLMMKSLILPILTLTLAGMSLIMYFTRNEIVSILNSDHILMARSKGLSEWTIFRKYVVRNTSLPVLTILVPSFILIFGGSFVIELFFDIPGTASTIINAIKFGEINVVMFSTLFLSALGTYATILVDMLYVSLDPRITYAAATETKSIKYMKQSHARFIFAKQQRREAMKGTK